MTIKSKIKIKMGSSFRWNDGGVWHRQESARALPAWIPAFAGMTVTTGWRVMESPCVAGSIKRKKRPKPLL